MNFDIPMDVTNSTMDFTTDEDDNSISSTEEKEKDVEIENTSSMGIT